MSPSKIVITGTIASGKSTLAKLLIEKGYEVISADDINKELLEIGNINYKAIKNSKEFDQAFDGDRLDKKVLAQIIFSDNKKMDKINSLTHKNILKEIDDRVNQSDQKVVFIEIPLYFQMQEKYEADQVWLVVANMDRQIDRLIKRDGIDREYAKSKIEGQKEKISMEREADIVFDNSKSIIELNSQLESILENKDLI